MKEEVKKQPYSLKAGHSLEKVRHPHSLKKARRYPYSLEKAKHSLEKVRQYYPYSLEKARYPYSLKKPKRHPYSLKKAGYPYSLKGRRANYSGRVYSLREAENIKRC